MSEIALQHGGTIDKFVGDAMLIFFGDPETKGEAEDAKACLRMAVDMQQRLAELNVKWRNAGIEHPFRVRMGINTGYLQCRQFRQRRPDGLHDHRRRGEPRRAPAIDRRARPYRRSATRPMRWCATSSSPHALPPITMKGISREVVPYAVDGMLDATARRSRCSANT